MVRTADTSIVYFLSVYYFFFFFKNSIIWTLLTQVYILLHTIYKYNIYNRFFIDFDTFSKYPARPFANISPVYTEYRSFCYIYRPNV